MQKRNGCRRVLPGALCGLILTSTVGHAQTPPAGLRIVIVEGENAVNVIQQKTAVAPVVEVRDRNDQPVAGVVVQFAIRSGKATFGGPKTLAVTTNTAGRAAVTTLTPTGGGALQINATASFQGQTASITIAQTNVMTVAQAAAVSSAGAGGGAGAGAGGAAGGGAAAGSGAGLSATTIGIIGGAAAAGVVAAKELTGSQGTEYAGPYSGTFAELFSGTCVVTLAHSGTVTVEIEVDDSGGVKGTGGVQGTATPVSWTAGCGTFVPTAQSGGCCSPDAQVQGTTGKMTFNGSHPGNLGTNWTYDFSGALNGSQVSGTFTMTTTSPSAPIFVRPFPVTLTKK
ncbi:MAG TPA: hypothetical protein VKH42_03270 [Vicinamibacterales bacterium]|nr:hypothetical protein [Vicinamibacterales bacterium]